MKIKLIVLLLFFIATDFYLNAQQVISQEIQIEGVIINKEDHKPVPFVHIINIQGNTGTVSNLQGRFSIKIKHSDTLVLSAIGFDKYIFSLTKNIDTKQLDVTIEMNTNSYELEPVRIFAYKDERDFKRAILDMEVSDADTQGQIRLPGVYYGVKRDYKPSVLSPLSYIYYKTSKREKEKRKYELLKNEYEGWKKIANKYNPILVKEITGLEEDEIEDFMSFCKLSNKYLEVSSEYEIVMAINNCLKEYQKNIDNNLNGEY
ncbi:MAG: carboxypeptidase-like regulatory domain-containing protein [Cyclobacteriaceae bacterium]|nr:carboxypeptidase-like regulatory domain-containing protein [Cyclobacteriaceae bacterium]